MNDQAAVPASGDDTKPEDIAKRDKLLHPKKNGEPVAESNNAKQPQLDDAQRGDADKATDNADDQGTTIKEEPDPGLKQVLDIEAAAAVVNDTPLRDSERGTGVERTQEDQEADAAPKEVSLAGSACCWRPTAVVNMDGLEGSGLRAGAYVARYGGGDDFRAVEPLLSAEVLHRSAQDCPGWQQACCALAEVTMDSIQLIHGFSDAAILDNGKAPKPSDVEWSNPQILVTRAPKDSDYFSLMLHGWLFPAFAQSDRKGHQKFPLLTVFCSEGSNLRRFDSAENVTKQQQQQQQQQQQGEASEEEAHQQQGADAVAWVPPHLRCGEPPSLPRWIPTAGKPRMTWADQHVHRDEPIDLGGFLFREVFFGSDMARVAVQEKNLPAFFWLTAVDVEAKRGLRSFCIIIPRAVPPLSARERPAGVVKVAVAQALCGRDESARSDDIHTLSTRGGCCTTSDDDDDDDDDDDVIATDETVVASGGGGNEEQQNLEGDSSSAAAAAAAAGSHLLSDPPPHQKVPRNDTDGGTEQSETQCSQAAASATNDIEAAATPQEEEEGGIPCQWQCRTCTFVDNPANAPACQMCYEPRASSGGETAGKATRQSFEDELDAGLRDAKTMESLVQRINQHWGRTCAENMLRLWQA